MFNKQTLEMLNWVFPICLFLLLIWGYFEESRQQRLHMKKGEAAPSNELKRLLEEKANCKAG